MLKSKYPFHVIPKKNTKVTKGKMAEGGKEIEGESSIVKRELFPEQGSSVDSKNNELSLLIKITKENGESLPYGVVNNQLIIELFQNVIGALPSSILTLNDQDVLLDFPQGISVFEMAKLSMVKLGIGTQS